jgi:2-polyprenyl-3-methyl-5-hydroxy-6-metoxy-1,4-benzoquinol methylase
MNDPSSAAFFDAKYATVPDPWSFETDPYEQARYERITRHIDPDRHRTAFEPGCSVGVLTERIGRLGLRVDSTDLSMRAVERARDRCRHLDGVHITVGDLTPPQHRYDLIVLSEIGYYLDPTELLATSQNLAARVAPGGRLIAAHWIGTSPDHRLHADDVHRIVGDAVRTWIHMVDELRTDRSRDGYRLDVWDRP